MNDRQFVIGMKISAVFLSNFSSIQTTFAFYRIEKYDIVGRLLKPGEQASVYPSEESSVDATGNTDSKKTE